MGPARHAGVQHLVRDLNALYRTTPALWELDHDPAGFEWLTADDADHNVLAYVRRSRSGDPVVVIVNFAGVPHEGYRLPLPTLPLAEPAPSADEPVGTQDSPVAARAGASPASMWLEALNTDATVYGGSGVGNMGRVQAEQVPHHGRAWSAVVRVPPLAALVLVPADRR